MKKISHEDDRHFKDSASSPQVDVTVSDGATPLLDRTEANQLGVRLRDMRQKRGLSLKVLAQRSDVSVGMISQIERGLANPSVRILEQLRVALDVPLTTLLEGDDVPVGVQSVPDFVRRADQRPHFTVTAGGLSKELLSPHGQHDLQFMIITIPSGARSKEILLGSGEKAGMVLEGTIVLTVGGRSEEIGPGDSFQFNSELAHSVENIARRTARILWIMNVRPPVVHL
ncbi:helix-turn-helix domain-containing protein [Robbsia andropogonis]|uniref:helix-turn-helix domain-containing protein n=1 Tax=Robbsia andropogonis TaxID=28092 RepID=UPI00209D94D9|nr:helix-turn-helix domain-containing protein [Robbsia andropogonis]MCP1118128.1 helix-turn-helix domain-containing protein [Robbsia andropogonis]MCP1127591.1 helix-turn-helix domain-containing protein [Robbsia andropogonis]